MIGYMVAFALGFVAGVVGLAIFVHGEAERYEP